jgi:hypothetical protein
VAAVALLAASLVAVFAAAARSATIVPQSSWCGASSEVWW